jgi:hypothetical protein
MHLCFRLSLFHPAPSFWVERKADIAYKTNVKTEKVLRLMFGIFGLASISELLSRHFHSDLFLFIYLGLQLSVGALMLYALFRENNLGDKSENISNKATLAIFAGVGLMLLLVGINALRH